MVISKNTVVSLAYKIHADRPDGELIEFADQYEPRQIVFGLENHIPGFENEMMGRGPGDFSFEINAGDAFGSKHENLKMWIPKNVFMDQGELRTDLLILGNTVNLLDNEGRKVTGVVKELSDDEVFMDFNHPLAGKKLFVTGEILSVRPAEERDMKTSGSCGCGSECGCGSHNDEYEDSCCSTSDSEDEGCEACGYPPAKEVQEHSCQCGN